MTTTPRLHTAPDTMDNSRRPVWSSRLPWLLLVVTLVISSVWVQRLRSDVQRSRTAAAALMWSELNDLSFHIESAASLWTDGTVGLGHLSLARQQGNDMQSAARMYEQVIKTAPEQSGKFAALFRLFSLAADTINHSADVVDKPAAVKALQADMRLVLTLFPQDLLARGAATELDQAMATWCTQAQLKTVMQIPSLPDFWKYNAPCR